jgi:DNA-binding response OmpR family regulator
MPKVVVIEDDQAIRELVVFNLEKEQYIAVGFGEGIPAEDYLMKNSADLVVLDLMLPDIDGLEICKDLKKNDRTKNIPIIMLTAKGEETDRVLGLELGADDYIVKPFSPKELIARIRAVLRRINARAGSAVLSRHGISLDASKFAVEYNGRAVALTATEFKVLETLIRSPGRVFTRHMLLETLSKLVVDRNIDVHITALRKKLGDGGRHIKTIRGIGYKLEE